MKITEISKLFENEPLIINWHNIKRLKNNKSGSIFFGLGLVSRNQLSVGIPFDILSFFFVSEILKNSLNLSKVIVLIADSHALSNRIFDNMQIQNQANLTLTQAQKIVRNFAFNNFEIIMASDMHKLPSFQSILSKLPKFENKYLRLEIADTLWLTNNRNLKIKIGWAISKENRTEGNDERFFDNDIIKMCPNLSLIHLQAGRTLDSNRPKASPYLSVRNEHRILLLKNENVNEKLKTAKNNWTDKSMGGLISHLHDIVHSFENIQGRLPFNTLEQKIKFILDKATV